MNGSGKCPICGHRIQVKRKHAPSATRKLWVAVMLFLVTCLFTIGAIKIFNKKQKSELLTVTISDVSYTDNGYIVRGNIRNFSDETYSIPDLVFLFKTDTGAILNKITQLPPNGLIDPMSDVEFIKKLEPKVVGAGKISVEFDNHE
jgi:hypothetical protein